MAPSPLTKLAEELLENSRQLDAYNESNGLKPASFDYESFIDLPNDVENRRKNVINLAQDLRRLAQGPRDLLFEILNTVSKSLPTTCYPAS
jgi:hypothetical protein